MEQGNRPIQASPFEIGTTRKYAMPIGEYLDRIGLTRREGDVRKLGQIEPAS